MSKVLHQLSDYRINSHLKSYTFALKTDAEWIFSFGSLKLFYY